MASRELVVLGTASQAPTRARNHNGYFLRWDAAGLLFDPGEGTQRQMLFAGVTASQVTGICVTHFHGDHCLGLPGVLQRMALDQVAHPVTVSYPAESGEYFGRLRHAALFHDSLALAQRPLPATGLTGTAVTGTAPPGTASTGTAPPGTAVTGTAPPAAALVTQTPAFRLEARPLSHRVPTVGYRLAEPDGRRMLPAALAARGISGPDIALLQKAGAITLPNGAVVTVDEVSELRRGQKFAFVMDTRICDAAVELARDADLLVCEATFADAEAGLADSYGHLTAGQAGQIAAEAGARTLVMTHFSQRYRPEELAKFADEAAASFTGDIVVASDLDRIPVPPRRLGEYMFGFSGAITPEKPNICGGPWDRGPHCGAGVNHNPRPVARGSLLACGEPGRYPQAGNLCGGDCRCRPMVGTWLLLANSAPILTAPSPTAF